MKNDTPQPCHVYITKDAISREYASKLTGRSLAQHVSNESKLIEKHKLRCRLHGWYGETSLTTEDFSNE
jgi:hypothetical protein